MATCMRTHTYTYTHTRAHARTHTHTQTNTSDQFPDRVHDLCVHHWVGSSVCSLSTAAAAAAGDSQTEANSCCVMPFTSFA